MKKFNTQLIAIATTCLLAYNLNAQIITTVIGTGVASYGGDGGPANMADIYAPNSVAFDAAGNMYISEFLNSTIRKINTSGIITTVAGTGIAGFSGDGGLATNAQINGPASMTVDAIGNIYIADTYNFRIRKVNTSGIISTIAGNGTQGYTGDGGPATSAALIVNGIGVDAVGNVYVPTGQGNAVRIINTSGVISTFAGTGVFGYSGDGGPATAAEIGSTGGGLGFDASGNVYFADAQNGIIRMVDTVGDIYTFAGNGSTGFSGDGGLATAAQLSTPRDIEFDASGNAYIPEWGSHRVRKVSQLGIITTFAGSGVAGYGGDGGVATSANLQNSNGIGIDASGNVYIADRGNNRVRKVTMATGINQSEDGALDYSIYPNPSNSFLAIESKTSETKTAKLFSVTGEQLLSEQFQSNLKIDLLNFSSGIYFIKIQSDKNVFTQKIIVKH